MVYSTAFAFAPFGVSANSQALLAVAKGFILASHNYANIRITVRSKNKAVGVVAEDLDTVPFLITKYKCAAAFIGIQSELHMNHCNQSTDLLAKICNPTLSLYAGSFLRKYP